MSMSNFIDLTMKIRNIQKLALVPMGVAMKLEKFVEYRVRQLRYLCKRLTRLPASPEHIARGLAFGVFAGFFPLFGLQTIIGVGLATAFRGHKLSAALGTWVSNPLTYVPIYALNFKVGRWLLHSQDDFVLDSVESISELTAEGMKLAVPLFVGCAVMGLIVGAIAYFVGVRLIRRWRSRRRWRKYPS